MAQNNNQEIESQSVAKSRRRGSVEQVRKQQKRDLMTFSTPDVLVTLLVGWESVRFTVSKNIACYHSPVFHAAFNGSYVESTSLEYRMAHVDEPTARLLLQYLYYNALSLVQFDDRCDTHDQLSTEEQHALTVQDNDLVCLWVLADELGMPQLQNEVITQFHAIQEKLNCIPAAPINLIYDITSMESQLRRYIVTFAPETSTLPILLRTENESVWMQ
ncbi:uncharacterized protein LY89DRAFT_728896 [Mollisia scopiformis]|uniref:BTB domain-containing protein n=1 Tax=Mollisia scopiformis TaxID=149040 RepID=A0A194XSS6_MOLSC|nr:uncharacterized protein LY89DRAFT_728896 [Mollisia scopiformis]KUJ22782.1 hypothetical protein LY89DRAFT_728896 [Mollisia scopiformis]